MIFERSKYELKLMLSQKVKSKFSFHSRKETKEQHHADIFSSKHPLVVIKYGRIKKKIVTCV